MQRCHRHRSAASGAHTQAEAIVHVLLSPPLSYSHPFDVETYSHCHLSAIDVQTQTGWQMASGAWTSIVVDPLRSLAKQEPEIGVYRVYPPKYTPPVNEVSNGRRRRRGRCVLWVVVCRKIRTTGGEAIPIGQASWTMILLSDFACFAAWTAMPVVS